LRGWTQRDERYWIGRFGKYTDVKGADNINKKERKKKKKKKKKGPPAKSKEADVSRATAGLGRQQPAAQ
jgi:hypothetical protein